MRALSFAVALLVPVALTAQAPAVVTIDSGMTKDQVVAKLGTPLSDKTRGTSNFLSFPNGCEKACGMPDLVILDNDHVVDAIFRSPQHVYSGKSSSPRMISRDSAQRIAVSKGDTAAPPARARTSPSTEVAKAPAPIKVQPPAVDATKKAAGAPPKKSAPVAQAGKPANVPTPVKSAPATKAAPATTAAPNRSTGAPATKAPPAVPHRSPVVTQPAPVPDNANALVLWSIEVGIMLVISILVVGGMWRVFQKAGQPGWAALIPIYNLVVTLDIAGKPIWWLLLLLVPVVNIIVWLVVMVEIAKRFGKGPVFGIGLLVLSMVFFPVLGFGDAEYGA